MRATAIAAVLALVVAGSGQAFQAVACPSHADSRADARHAEQATPSQATHAHEGHGQAAEALDLDRSGDEAPETEHGEHACSCVGACCQNAVAKGSAAEGLTRRLGFRVPLALELTGSRRPAPASAAYLLPFATAPPSSN